MALSNYPDGVSENSPDAPWNQGADDDEVLGQDKVEYLSEALSYLEIVMDNLTELERLAKNDFFIEIRRIADVGPRNHDRMDSLKLLIDDLESWLSDIRPEED